ncbi:unnamed protein product, partial [Effrenium voratum]
AEAAEAAMVLKAKSWRNDVGAGGAAAGDNHDGAEAKAVKAKRWRKDVGAGGAAAAAGDNHDGAGAESK